MKIQDFKRKKKRQEKICCLTCYDYPSARTIAESPIDCVLVGDSVAMTVHGYDSTVHATMDMMALHTKAVARGLNHQFLVSDLPFLAHRISLEHTVKNVQQLMQAGAHAIKLEGADLKLYRTITYLVNCGVPVMGHIGLTPQSIHQLGGFIVQGKAQDKAEALVEQARALEKAGCFALVLECVPSTLAKTITECLSIPTIGIGAGKDTDGQILVWHDLLGLQTEFKPKFVKQYTTAKSQLLEAINVYAREVQDAHFPTLDHSY